MAIREHLRCTVCGSLRKPEAFGIRSADEFEPGIRYESAVLVQELGGRGKCSWTTQALPTDVAMLQRQRMKEALDQLDAELRDAGVEESFFADGEESTDP
jgi:hypothetical protein